MVACFMWLWQDSGALINSCWVLVSLVLRGLAYWLPFYILLEHDYPLWNFGYLCGDEMNYQQAFEQRRHVLLDQVYVGSVVVKIGHRSWTMFLHNGRFNPEVFAAFIAELHLKNGDYLFLNVLPNLEVRLVIFDSMENKERLYDWF